MNIKILSSKGMYYLLDANLQPIKLTQLSWGTNFGPSQVEMSCMEFGTYTICPVDDIGRWIEDLKVNLL